MTHLHVFVCGKKKVKLNNNFTNTAEAGREGGRERERERERER